MVIRLKELKAHRISQLKKVKVETEYKLIRTYRALYVCVCVLQVTFTLTEVEKVTTVSQHISKSYGRVSVCGFPCDIFSHV